MPNETVPLPFWHPTRLAIGWESYMGGGSCVSQANPMSLHALHYVISTPKTNCAHRHAYPCGLDITTSTLGGL
jgi:hypothetical protein